MKKLLLLSAAVAAWVSAFAADYDYEVEFVKSTHGSVVKTDLVPELGVTFRLSVMLDGEFNQIFGPKFDHNEETSVDISALPAGEHKVTVKALGKDWPATVKKLPYKKGATQINRWSRSLVHDGEKIFMSAPCLIGRENGPKKDGTS